METEYIIINGVKMTMKEYKAYRKEKEAAKAKKTKKKAKVFRIPIMSSNQNYTRRYLNFMISQRTPYQAFLYGRCLGFHPSPFREGGDVLVLFGIPLSLGIEAKAIAKTPIIMRIIVISKLLSSFLRCKDRDLS